MLNTNNDAMQKLGQYTHFSYRNITKGEFVLLAKAISDEINLPSDSSTDISAFMLVEYKTKIMYLLDDISTLLYIEDKDLMYNLIKDFVNWRFSIAFKPSVIIFNSGIDSVIDDMTCLNKFVDKSILCAVTDVYDDSIHIYSIFRSVAKILLQKA